MKVLFAGPSLHGADWSADRAGGSRQASTGADPQRRATSPAPCVEGATVIGLIDGLYEDRAAPWHKEILFALENGAQVFGAASMGALRAAECADFGMIGVGAVFERYRSRRARRRRGCGTAARAGGARLPAADGGAGQCRGDDRALPEAEGDHRRGSGAARRKRPCASSSRSAPIRASSPKPALAKGERGKRLAALIKRCRVDVKREDALILLAYLAHHGAGAHRAARRLADGTDLHLRADPRARAEIRRSEGTARRSIAA